MLCDHIVERAADGSCPWGHPLAAVSGSIALAKEDPVPQLPRFNLAAFLLPPVWGPFHGQWAGVIFLPIWLFADNVVAVSLGGGASLGGVIVVVATLSTQALFAKRANGAGWRRVANRITVAEYAHRERIWAALSIPVAVVLFGSAVYYRLMTAH